MSVKVDIAAALAYRKAKFAVKVEPSSSQDWNPGGVVLSVTSNGRQWESILLMPDEIGRVIEALQAAKREAST